MTRLFALNAFSSTYNMSFFSTGRPEERLIVPWARGSIT